MSQATVFVIPFEYAPSDTAAATLRTTSGSRESATVLEVRVGGVPFGMLRCASVQRDDSAPRCHREKRFDSFASICLPFFWPARGRGAKRHLGASIRAWNAERCPVVRKLQKRRVTPLWTEGLRDVDGRANRCLEDLCQPLPPYPLSPQERHAQAAAREHAKPSTAGSGSHKQTIPTTDAQVPTFTQHSEVEHTPSPFSAPKPPDYFDSTLPSLTEILQTPLTRMNWEDQGFLGDSRACILSGSP